MGLWISFLVRSDSEVPPTLVPILVGLAAARALERLCPSLRPGIKWPNDIEVEGRKLGVSFARAPGPERSLSGSASTFGRGSRTSIPG